MKRFLTIITSVFLLVLNLWGQGIRGTWKGELDYGTSKLAIVFHFDDSGCTMDSPDQGTMGIAAELAYMSADSVSVVQKDMDARFSGRISGDRIVGRFSQRGLSLPLVLTPGDVIRSRPQTPSEPFPYKTEEVSFNNGDATLAGTVSYPSDWNGRKRIPVAVMVSGSGLQNRDEELFGHKPFLVIADYLARNGIATLRYDDRSAGKSVGDAVNATTEDFMKDALSGISFLRSMGKFGKIGIIGHSEGGEIAFMLGARKEVDFLVSLAGPGVQGDSILVLQNINALRKSGFDGSIPKEAIRQSIKSQGNPWLEYFIDYDPVQDIKGIKVPALILNGSKDTQVEAEVNIPSIEANLPRNRKGKYVSRWTLVKVYPDLNHLFQHCTTGQAEEYRDIEETISTEVLSDIASWIGKL
ncbi:MAG: alpha/beta hydrolase [Bacteroidales bacterium]|nr:alpha/beta hydrolase [Bacteroidales bacterium]